MDIVLISLFIICGVLFLVWLIAVIYSTIKRKGLWGINLRQVNCPNCCLDVPRIRTPKSIHQAMWGGWNCSNCGCEMDKWGKEMKCTDTKTPQKQIDKSQVEFVSFFDEKGKTPVEKVFEENK